MLSTSISRENIYTAITNTGDYDHQTISTIMELSSNASGPQVTARDSYITKENKMSQQGVHSLLRGFDKSQRAAAPRHPVQTSGMESAQRKRYLYLEAEKPRPQVFFCIGNCSKML